MNRRHNEIRALARKVGKGHRGAANLLNRGHGAGVRIVPKFDPSLKTQQLSTGAHQDPVRPVEVVNGTRTILVWIFPTPQGTAGWRFEVTRQTGAWPLKDDERAALEKWLEWFAKEEWPTRAQLWPPIYRTLPEAWGHGPGLSAGTRQVLCLLISRWTEAMDGESDPVERRAFGEPIGILEQALARPGATHEDIRKAMPACPPHPNFGKRTLMDLADAERDGNEVRITQREDGAIKWDILPRGSTPAVAAGVEAGLEDIMSNGPLSHVTTRRLTRSWEYGDRRLYGYDFSTDLFFDRSSRSLLVADRSFGHDVERFLNRHIENPLADHLDALAEGTFVSNIPWPQERALILSMLFQPMRVLAGRGDAEGVTRLRDLITRDEAFLDQLAQASRTRFRFIGGKLGHGQLLYFPEDGLAGLPLVGTSASAPAMMFQPTTLNTFFAAVPVEVPEHEADEQIHTAMENGTLAAFSVGLLCVRVIIPPEIRGRATEENMRTALQGLRTAARGFTRVIGQMNRTVGF